MAVRATDYIETWKSQSVERREDTPQEGRAGDNITLTFSDPGTQRERERAGDLG